MSSDRIDAPHTRDSHRLFCIFTLDRVELKRSVDLQTCPSLVDEFELDRLERNFKSEAATAALPRVLANASVHSLYWSTQIGGVNVSSIEAILVAAPVGGGVLALMTIEFSGELMQVIPMLCETAMGRDNVTAELTPSGPLMPLGHALARVIPSEVADTDRAAFGPDVHQLFFPSAAATPELVTPAIGGVRSGPNLDRISRIVYRSDYPFRPELSGMQVPRELNRPAGAASAHGRGVTVLAGAAEHVENGVVLTATELLAAVAHLRSIRNEASNALREVNRGLGDMKTLSDRRHQLARQSWRLARMQVDLSFGVESAMDPAKVPEIVLEPYRKALSQTLGLADGAQATATMLARLSAAITALQNAGTAFEQEAAERRRGAFGLLAIWVSVIALVGSALAFFGTQSTQVSNSYSLFSVRHYWGFYLFWAGLAAMTALLYRVQKQRLSKADQEAFQATADAIER
jgi:hypothetical protein